MAGFIIVVAAALFLAVVVALGMIAFAIRREDKRFSLVVDAPDMLSRGARRLNGVGRRDLDPEFFRIARELVH